jgi:repressor LexA
MEEQSRMALTKRQKQVMDFIAGFVDENGYSPSFDEIARGLRLASLATVHKHISALERKAYLKRGYNQSRSLEIGPKFLQEQRRARLEAPPQVPLLGRIAAGAPVEAFEQRSSLSFADFASNPDMFALEVRGESMIEDHICDGDMILLERVSQARDGDIVVALISGNETTLKRFYLEPGDKVRLQPANPALRAILLPASEVQIQGRLVAVLRKYK